jgi:hypothetical protein
MQVPCSGLAMDPSVKFFYSLVCTSKELAKFRLVEEEGGGKLKAVASTPSQHELALHSMQFSPWGDLVLLGKITTQMSSSLSACYYIQA